MMTLEKAIKILSELHDQCCQADNIFCTDTTGARCEAVDMAISALQAQDLQPTCNNLATDTISEQSSCVYCHEDSDGYITPLEKNCHAFVIHSPIHGWILSIKYGAWKKDIPIRFCPVCGRELKIG